MTVGERIKEIREKTGMSQVEFASKMNVSKQTLYKYENNIITNIPSDKVEAAAKIGDVSPSYLMGWDSILSEGFYTQKKSKNATIINVLGRVAAGIPLDAIEEIIDTEEISQAMASDGEYFGLRITGDSMEPRIKDGDVVIVRRQSDADDGDLVIALVNGNDAVCKRLKKYAEGIALISTNPKYDPMYFTQKEIAEKPVSIIGKVKELRAKF